MDIHDSNPIDVRGLRKLFRDGVAVDDISFTVPSGRVVGLLGPNGAGKTTTIRMILDLAARDAGEALVHGRPYREWPHPARLVGTVLDAGGLHPGRTGRQHLRIAAAQVHAPDARIAEVLGEVDMTGSAGRRIGGYSLGMRQRIALATALLGSPRVLVLDEPANGLDPAGMRWLRQRLRAFADDGGAVLLSSHVLSDVAQVADRVVVVTDGRVAADVPLTDATAAGDLEAFYLDHVGTGQEVR
jgi:ABC-2 type transport system ATP-binding protein